MTYQKVRGKYVASWMEARDQLDRLIDWYERFRPEAGQIIQVELTRAEALKFAHEEGDRVMYRSRQLDCLLPAKK